MPPAAASACDWRHASILTHAAAVSSPLQAELASSYLTLRRCHALTLTLPCLDHDKLLRNLAWRQAWQSKPRPLNHLGHHKSVWPCAYKAHTARQCYLNRHEVKHALYICTSATPPVTRPHAEAFNQPESFHSSCVFKRRQAEQQNTRVCC